MNTAILNSLSRCGICSSSFKDPTILPCSHCVCFTCIQSDKSKEGTTCPICRTEHEENPNNLPKNKLLQKLQERNNEISNTTPQKCENECNEKASCWCITCKANLCDKCWIQVHSLPVLKTHNKISLFEKKRKSFKLCEKHNEERKIFCKKDNKIICSLCLLDNDHVNHNVCSIISFLDTIAEMQKNRSKLTKESIELNINGCLEEISEKNEKIKTIQTEINEIEIKIQREKNKINVLNEIDTTVKLIVDSIDVDDLEEMESLTNVIDELLGNYWPDDSPDITSANEFAEANKKKSMVILSSSGGANVNSILCKGGRGIENSYGANKTNWFQITYGFPIIPTSYEIHHEGEDKNSFLVSWKVFGLNSADNQWDLLGEEMADPPFGSDPNALCKKFSIERTNTPYSTFKWEIPGDFSITYVDVWGVVSLVDFMDMHTSNTSVKK